MRTLAGTALAALFLAVPATAEDKEGGAKKPLGTWTRSAGDAELQFQFKADTLNVTLTRGGDTIKLQADYGISKDGVVFGRVSKVESTGGGPSEGDLFSFKAQVTQDTLQLSDVKATHASEEARQLVEGEYKKAAE